MRKSTKDEIAKKLRETKMQSMMLEFAESDDGKLVLRPTDSDEQPLVSIEFSDKIKEMLGADVRMIGHSMIQAGIHMFMQQQMANYHAHVYDEEPTHFS